DAVTSSGTHGAGSGCRLRYRHNRRSRVVDTLRCEGIRSQPADILRRIAECIEALEFQIDSFAYPTGIIRILEDGVIQPEELTAASVCGVRSAHKRPTDIPG